MFDKIIYISDHSANIKLKEDAEVVINLMNLHLVFEDSDKKVLGEVDDLDGDIVKARFLGEIVGDKLVGGTIRKPSLDAKIRVIDKSEIPMITGKDEQGYMKLGVSPFYNDYPVFLDVNNFFSNHFAIFGNTGSGKSCGVTRVFQNMFQDQRLYPYKANILLFDSSGEYYNAFNNLNTLNPNYHYRFFTTNETENKGEKLRLPIYLLNTSDLALLLQCTSHSQLPIVERMLKLALIFSQKDVDANKYKNHLIAKAIMTILYTNETSPNKRNEVFSILASCSTPEFSLETPVQGIGYTRKFRELFLINSDGQFAESVLLTEYVSSFIKAEFDDYEPKTGVYYNLDTLEKALNFTLISEGWLRNTNTYGDAVTIKVRLHALIVGNTSKYFDVPDYISLESYLSSMLINNGNKYQIVNINLDDVDDDFAKVMTKIYSRLVFEFAKGLKDRASIPFHIVVEEAHRYIQNDTDRFLIGYNIFERIAKEGRKYGVILGLISQRPVELSDTVISQCTNFLIFKMNHPVDVEYIRKMVPNISDEIVEKQKTLQSGTCLGFGLAFRIPLIVKMEMPNPAPWSGNCDVVNIWNGNGGGRSNIQTMQEVVSTPSANIDFSTINMNMSNNNSNNGIKEISETPGLSITDEKEEKFDDSFVVPTGITNTGVEEEQKNNTVLEIPTISPIKNNTEQNDTKPLVTSNNGETIGNVNDTDNIPDLVDVNNNPSIPNLVDMNTNVSAPEVEEVNPSIPNMIDMDSTPSISDVSDVNPSIPNMIDVNNGPGIPNLADMNTNPSIPNLNDINQNANPNITENGTAVPELVDIKDEAPNNSDPLALDNDDDDISDDTVDFS